MSIVSPTARPPCAMRPIPIAVTRPCPIRPALPRTAGEAARHVLAAHLAERTAQCRLRAVDRAWLLMTSTFRLDLRNRRVAPRTCQHNAARVAEHRFQCLMQLDTTRMYAGFLQLGCEWICRRWLCTRSSTSGRIVSATPPIRFVRSLEALVFDHRKQLGHPHSGNDDRAGKPHLRAIPLTDCAPLRGRRVHRKRVCEVLCASAMILC